MFLRIYPELKPDPSMVQLVMKKGENVIKNLRKKTKCNEVVFQWSRR